VCEGTPQLLHRTKCGAHLFFFAGSFPSLSWTMTTPYTAYVRQFTARLQARVHRQSYANVVQYLEQHQPTPAGNIADARLREVQSLVEQHRRSFDPSIKQKALGILQTLPLKSIDEDPHFMHTLAGLRVCAYFGAAKSPATYNFLNHVTRHTYLLDGHAVFRLYLVLDQLHHEQTTEIVQVLLPRIREVVDDFSISEARLIMEFLAQHKMLDAELTGKFAAVMQGGLQDMTIWELGRCVNAILAMQSIEVALTFLTAAAPRICRVLRDSVAQRHYYKALFFAETETSSSGDAAAAAASRSTAMPSSSTREASGVSSSAKKTAVRASHAQLKDFLILEQRATASLLQGLCNAVIHLSWGPRRVLNEMVHMAIAWSEEESCAALPRDSSRGDHDSARSEAPDVQSTAGSFTKAERRGYEEYVQKLPQLSRHDLSKLLKALHFASHLHPAGLRLLSARIATKETAVVAAAGAENVALTRLNNALALAIEAVAYFYAVDCIPAVLSMLEEIQTGQLINANTALRARMSAAATAVCVLTWEERETAESIGLRTLLSCARLLSACEAASSSSTSVTKKKFLPSHRPVELETMGELCRHMAALAASPLLQIYVEYARMAARQDVAAKRKESRRAFAGAAHVLYSIAVLFQAISASGAAKSFVADATSFMDSAALATLRESLRNLVQLVQTVTERQPETLSVETTKEVWAALEMVQKHPEWLPDGV
jgi:hypothetical protein